MSTKPTELPEWDTQSTVNTAEPTVDFKDDGWPADSEAISSYFNWWMNRTYLWTEYLRDGDFQDPVTFDDTVGITGQLSCADIDMTGQLNCVEIEATSTITAIGSLIGQAAIVCSSDLTPASFGSTQNNYAPTGHGTTFHLRLTPTAAGVQVTGLAGGVAGRLVVVTNIATVGGGNTVVLATESGSSTAANRFALAANVTIAAGEAVLLIYDGTSSRWRKVS